MRVNGRSSERQTNPVRYRTLFASAPIALLVTSRDLTIVECNAAAADLLAVAGDSLVGKALTVHVDLGYRRTLRAWGMGTGETATTMNLRLRRRTGTSFDAAVSVTATDDELCWAIVDRTEQAQSEERMSRLRQELERRLEEQAAELQTLAGRLPVGVVVLRGGGVAWSNARARAILGERLEAIVPHVARASASNDIRESRAQVARANGDTIVVDITAAPLVGRGGGIVVVVDDVTRRDRLERADAEFVENAAHQLRNPVAAIASSVAALHVGADDDAAERSRFLEHIARESARMASLVDGLLALAALQRGNATPRVEVARLQTLLREAAEMAERPGIRIGIDCGESLAIVGDRGLLRQALGNVLVNATQHARSDVLIEAHGRDEFVVVDVRDDGPGVPGEVRDRIFDRFYRASHSDQRGSGLGLAIAAAAAEAALARIELLPDDGKGAAFRFTMPGARVR